MNKSLKQMKEDLLRRSRHGNEIMDKSELKVVDKFCEGYKNFLNKSKTERQSIKEAISMAEKFGFVEFDSNVTYKPGEKIYCQNREKSVIFAVIGKNKAKNGFKMAISHVDSPRLDLKPNPIYESDSLVLLKTHYYGGIKKYQWLTCPLSLHGKIIKKNGESVEVSIGEDDEDPQFCITDLLPHLGRELIQKKISEAFLGENLNAIIGSRFISIDGEKVVGGDKKNLAKLNILSILNEKYGVTETDFLSAELEFVPAFKARDIGFDRSMIGAYGHDDRSCTYASLKAILECSNVDNTVITALVDKEEVGSNGNSGMKSSFFKDFLEDIIEKEDLKVRHVLKKSKCLSTDVSAAFDPNFKTYYEATNTSYINCGVVVTKYTGVGGKAGSSDASAEFMAEIRRIFDENNVLWQTGELGKIDDGGGGTIAKYVANLNVDVVDVGVPVLSMHSPFEVVSKIDVYSNFLAVKSFFESK